MTFLLIDSFDSFTHMLADYIRQCGVACDVIRNNEAILLDTNYINTYDALVLSPGPQTPHHAGHLMEVINRYHQTKPILGICLGHQAIGTYFGANLHQAIVPMHGKVTTITHNSNLMFCGIPTQFNVTRYHSLILSDIGEPLQVIAQTAQNDCMALSHKYLPIYGVQFHPESCLTEHGLTLIKNFVQIVKQHSY